METNHLSISGVILETHDVRYTPGGIPFRYFLLEHRSRQMEAQFPREVFCRIRVDVRGSGLQEFAESLVVGQRVIVEGFLARSGYKDESAAQLVLHATSILEGQ